MDKPNIYYISNIFILVSGASPGNWSKDTFSRYAQIDICPLHPLICELLMVRVFQPVSSSRVKTAYGTRNLVSACLVSRLDLVVLGHILFYITATRYYHGHSTIHKGFNIHLLVVGQITSDEGGLRNILMAFESTTKYTWLPRAPRRD